MKNGNVYDLLYKIFGIISCAVATYIVIRLVVAGPSYLFINLFLISPWILVCVILFAISTFLYFAAKEHTLIVTPETEAVATKWFFPVILGIIIVSLFVGAFLLFSYKQTLESGIKDIKTGTQTSHEKFPNDVSNRGEIEPQTAESLLQNSTENSLNSTSQNFVLVKKIEDDTYEYAYNSFKLLLQIPKEYVVVEHDSLEKSLGLLSLRIHHQSDPLNTLTIFVAHDNYCYLSLCELPLLETVTTLHDTWRYRGSFEYCDVGHCTGDKYTYYKDIGEYNVYVRSLTKLDAETSSDFGSIFSSIQAVNVSVKNKNKQ